MAHDQRPNILFIMTDDQGPWALGQYHEELETPNLDRLAEEGITLDHCFCASPVCSPARASVFTGLMPSQHGVQDWIRRGNLDAETVKGRTNPYGGYDDETEAWSYLAPFTTYTECLAEAGYTLSLSGKWHLGDSMRPQAGFTNWFTIGKGGAVYTQPDLIEHGKIQLTDTYTTDAFADKAIEYIDASGDGPFYCQLNFNAPHSPWAWDQHPKKWIDRYKDHDFAELPDLPDHPDISNGPFHGQPYAHSSRVGYYAAVSAMDEAVGRVLAHLDEKGLADHTIVIFMSDNGMNMGHHGCWGKGNATYPQNMYEESVTVPCIIRMPGVPGGRRSEALITACDLFPTLLELTGVAMPEDYAGPGESFAALLRNKPGAEEAAANRVAVSEEYGKVRMLRTRTMKLIRRHELGEDILYDLEKDPGETVNVIDDPAYAEVLKDLSKQMDAFFERYTDEAYDALPYDNRGLGQKALIGPRNASTRTDDRFFVRPGG